VWFALFANGANAGRLCLREYEFDTFVTHLGLERHMSGVIEYYKWPTIV